MTKQYFVEIVSNHGDVIKREAFSELPIRIGRAYHNDMILDDPHTAADHAIIEVIDNQLILRDLGSINGIKTKGQRFDQITLTGNSIIQLGQTFLRVRDNQFVVSAELSDTTNTQWQGLPLSLSAIIVISLLGLSNSWLNDISGNHLSDYIMSLATWLGAASLWAGTWALGNRVFSGQTNFARHLFILSMGLFALQILDYLCVLFAYSFSWEIFTRYSSHAEIAILIGTLYFHLAKIHSRKPWRLKIICILLSMTGSGLMLIKNYQSSNQFADELYMHDILPPALRISKDLTLDEFNASISQLHSQIDAEREKSLAEKLKK